VYVKYDWLGTDDLAAEASSRAAGVSTPLLAVILLVAAVVAFASWRFRLRNR
jgi:hypothetical protein